MYTIRVLGITLYPGFFLAGTLDGIAERNVLRKHYLKELKFN
jgi:hypothetical protein